MCQETRKRAKWKAQRLRYFEWENWSTKCVNKKTQDWDQGEAKWASKRIELANKSLEPNTAFRLGNLNERKLNQRAVIGIKEASKLTGK